MPWRSCSTSCGPASLSRSLPVRPSMAARSREKAPDCGLAAVGARPVAGDQTADVLQALGPLLGVLGASHHVGEQLAGWVELAGQLVCLAGRRRVHLLISLLLPVGDPTGPRSGLPHRLPPGGGLPGEPRGSSPRLARVPGRCRSRWSGLGPGLVQQRGDGVLGDGRQLVRRLAHRLVAEVAHEAGHGVLSSLAHLGRAVLDPGVEDGQTALQLLLGRGPALRQAHRQPAEYLRLHEGFGLGQGGREDVLHQHVPQASLL